MRRARRALVTLCLLAGGLSPAVVRPQGMGLDTWFPRLRVGMWVRVEGRRTAEGTLRASKIKVYDSELDEVEVKSYVAAVDRMRMTVQTTAGVPVVATPSTEVKGPKRHHHVSLAFIEVGDRIEIEGQRQKDGSLLAEEIEVEKSRLLRPDFRTEHKHKLRAPIESIDAVAHRIAVLGIPVQLSEDTVPSPTR